MALLILTGADPPPFPCAICRQSLTEFNRGEMLILAANTKGEIRETRLFDLYPEILGPYKLLSLSAGFTNPTRSLIYNNR